MGTWGIGIFEDDVCMDVKDCFYDLATKSNNSSEVSEKVLSIFKDVINDKDEGPLVYFALAELQMDKGFIGKDVKEKCIEYLRSGNSLDRWLQSGFFQFLKRRKILKKFSTKLKSFKNIIQDFDNDTEENIEFNPLRYTVYILEDSNSNVMYVGKTAFIEKRKKYMEVLFSNYKCKEKG